MLLHNSPVCAGRIGGRIGILMLFLGGFCGLRLQIEGALLIITATKEVVEVSECTELIEGQLSQGLTELTYVIISFLS